MPLLPFMGIVPTVADGVEIDAAGFVIGKVTLGRGVRIGPGTVLRADQDTITIGEDVRFGRGCTVHMDPRFPTQIGNEVVIEDDGSGFDQQAVAEWRPDNPGDGGMGLAIIHAVADDVEIGPRSGTSGTRIRFTRSLR